MNNALSLPPGDDLDTTMRVVARNIAMAIYELDDILKNCNVQRKDFEHWKGNIRFLEYLKQETDAWNATQNTADRVRLKSAVIVEDFLLTAHGELNDKKTPLNQRVELLKQMAKMANIGEPKPMGSGGPNSGGFQLQINIGPGVAPVTVTSKVIDHATLPVDEFDNYDPFTSPSTLDDEL